MWHSIWLPILWPSTKWSISSLIAFFGVSEKLNYFVQKMNVTVISVIDVNIPLATVGSMDNLTKSVIKLTSWNNLFTAQTDNNRLNATCTNALSN